MPTFLAYATAICYRSGLDAGGYITWFFYNMPITVWYLLAGVAFYSSDVYIQLLSSSYWLNLGVTAIIQESAKSVRPHQACNNQGYGLPAWEVSLAYHYIVMMACHRWLNARRLGLFDLFRAVLIGVLVPVVLSVSGNYTAWQLGAGVLVGSGVGAYVMIVMTTFWVDRLAFVTKDAPILNHWGFRNGSQSFYTDKEVALATPHERTEEEGAADAGAAPSDRQPLVPREEGQQLVESEMMGTTHPRPSFMEELVLGNPFAEKGRKAGTSTQKITRPPVLVHLASSSLPIVKAGGSGHFAI